MLLQGYPHKTSPGVFKQGHRSFTAWYCTPGLWSTQLLSWTALIQQPRALIQIPLLSLALTSLLASTPPAQIYPVPRAQLHPAVNGAELRAASPAVRYHLHHSDSNGSYSNDKISCYQIGGW